MAAPNEPDGAAEVLSQSEVERLLSQVAEQEGSSAVLQPGDEKERKDRDSVQPYDFRHPLFLSPTELRRLRIRHEDVKI